jgi:hypothetical protein
VTHLSTRLRMSLVWLLWLVVTATMGVGPLVFGAGKGGLGNVAIAIVQLSFMTVGALIATRLPAHPIGWLYLGVGCVIAGGGAAEEYARRALHDHALPAGNAAAVAADVFEGPVLIGCLAAMLLLFPNGRLASPRWRLPAWLGVAACAGATVTSVFAAGTLNAVEVANPYGVTGVAGDVVSVGQGVCFTAMFALIAAAAVALVVRFRRAQGELRQQLKWLVAAAALLGFTFVASIPLWTLGASWAGIVWTLLFSISTTAIPVATAFAILRYRLYEIDVIIRRTLSYAVLLAVLAGIYLTGVALFGTLLRDVAGSSGGAVVTISTLAAAAAFQPARSRIQAAVDRRFYRSRYDAALTLEAFSGRLREQIDLEALSNEMLQVVGGTLHPSHATLWLRSIGGEP